MVDTFALALLDSKAAIALWISTNVLTTTRASTKVLASIRLVPIDANALLVGRASFATRMLTNALHIRARMMLRVWTTLAVSFASAGQVRIFILLKNSDLFFTFRFHWNLL